MKECAAAAEYNRKNNIDVLDNIKNNIDWLDTNNIKFNNIEFFNSVRPHGCFHYTSSGNGRNKYEWMKNTKSTTPCSRSHKCICKPETCTKCPINTYSAGGFNPTCTPCPKENATTNFKSGQTSVNACKPVQPKICKIGHEVTGDGITTPKECKPCAINHYNDKHSEADVKCKPCKTHLKTKGTGQSRCIREFSEEYVMWKLENIDKIMAEQKEEANDLSIKNSRLWQKEQIRIKHDKIMQRRKKQDDKNEKSSCERQRSKGTVIFPAVEISNEIEKIEDTTCIDTNRDELLKSFCSFTSDLDNLFQIQSIDKEAKTFWPNICCKERNDNDISKTLESCEPPKGSNIKRENIIPFALSQGGHYNRHNLYVEVTEAIKEKGYLHDGMKNLLESFPSSVDTKEAKEKVDTFFNEVSLCGPRIVDAPGSEDKKKLCELFVPYQHSMAQFYILIESLFVKPITPQSASFLETMERSLRKRSETKRVGKSNIQNIMQMKPKAAEATCTGGSKWTSAELEEKKRDFCLGYKHLDLSDTNIKNVAVHYLKHDILYDDKKMFELSKQLRYQVTDISCPAPLFTANDISIQQVAMDVLGKEKEWVAVMYRRMPVWKEYAINRVRP
eukprot:g6765.t1